MTKPLNLFILAGEPSGDRIAADLVARLRARVSLHLDGIGGPELIAQGLTSRYPMSDLSVMGISDVLKRLPLLLWRLRQTVIAIRKADPDVVVLVDAQDFSALIARRLRKAGYRKPILLYVAPSVWARDPQRAQRIKPLFDEVLAVLPMEPGVMRQLGGPETHYVGHPALAEASVVASGTHIALLPGSRGGELTRQLPLLKAVAEQLHANGYGPFYIPTLPALLSRLEAETQSWAMPVELVVGKERRRERYGETALALVTSGTATLELALAEVPMVISYVLDVGQARRYEEINRPKVGLPNIILAEDAVPEFVVPNAEPAPVLAAALDLLENEEARNAQIASFGRLRALMEQGAPAEEKKDPADRVLSYFHRA